MEFEISYDQKPGCQRGPRVKSRANADPDEYAHSHGQGCFIPDEEGSPPEQMR